MHFSIYKHTLLRTQWWWLTPIDHFILQNSLSIYIQYKRTIGRVYALCEVPKNTTVKEKLLYAIPFIT